MPFQITIEVPVDVDFSALPLVTLSIFLSDGTGPITVDASGPGTGEAEKTCVIMSHVDHISASADGVEETVVKSPFMWRPGTTLVLSGTISSSVAQEIKVRDILFLQFGLYYGYSCSFNYTYTCTHSSSRPSSVSPKENGRSLSHSISQNGVRRLPIAQHG